jgi:D-alanine-D-alanine ligase
MKKLRVLALMHPDLVPPDDAAKYSEEERFDWKTEWDVVRTLRKIGHEVRALGVLDELHPIRVAVEEFRPDIAFNLLEEFQGNVLFDQNVVSLLELLRVPYTGCNPRGLMISREKALSKKLLVYHRIRVPDFHVFPMGRKVKRPRQLAFPLFVKSLTEHASLGISQASLVNSDEELVERVAFVQHPRGDGPLIATERVKHDLEYQKRHGIDQRPAENLPPAVAAGIAHLSKRIYRILGLSGYARLDYRLDEKGDLWFLEANPNPEIARSEEFASAAKQAGIGYPELLQRILNLGLRGAAAKNGA